MKTSPHARILLAEDEAHLSSVISYNLEAKGYDVLLCKRGDIAETTALSEPFDLIILDVMLPGKNGVAVCETIREKKILTPILMLTALGETEHRVKGLHAGADDYLPKPFALDELLARVSALLRRGFWMGGVNATTERTDTILNLGNDVLFDTRNLWLTKKNGENKRTELTATEALLLKLLFDNRGNALSRTEILKQVWGFSENIYTRTLDNFIMRLRTHLRDVGGNEDWIESVRGVGYRFKPVL